MCLLSCIGGRFLFQEIEDNWSSLGNLKYKYLNKILFAKKPSGVLGLKIKK